IVFFQAEDGIRDATVTGVQTCALPIFAHQELAQILSVTGVPLWTRAFSWPRGLPRYKPSHAGRVAEVRHRLTRLAPLDIAGAGFDGAGVSACVKSGREAARRMVERLGMDPGAPSRGQPSPGGSLRG